MKFSIDFYINTKIWNKSNAFNGFTVVHYYDEVIVTQKTTKTFGASLFYLLAYLKEGYSIER